MFRLCHIFIYLQQVHDKYNNEESLQCGSKNCTIDYFLFVEIIVNFKASTDVVNIYICVFCIPVH